MTQTNQVKKVTKKQQLEEEKQVAMESLRNLLEKANHRVYTSLLHVSSSGMSRRISTHIATEAGEIMNIDWYVEQVTGFKRDDKGGLKVGGCGMDMGFHIVYTLSSILYRNEDGSYSHDGAYKLKHSWM